MSEIRIQHHFLRRGDLVEGGELGRGRTDRVHQAGEHQHLGLDPGRQKLAVDVTEPGENLLHPFVPGIEPPEIKFQFLEGFLGQVHFPDAEIVAEKRVNRRRFLDPGFQGRAGQRQGASLRLTHRPQPIRIDFGQSHDDPGQFGGVQEDRPVEETLRIRVVQPANDMTAQGVALDPAHVLRFSALAAAVHRGDAKALTDVRQFIGPVAAVGGVAVKLQDRRALARRPARPEIFRVDPGAADPGKPQIETVSAPK